LIEFFPYDDGEASDTIDEIYEDSDLEASAKRLAKVLEDIDERTSSEGMGIGQNSTGTSQWAISKHVSSYPSADGSAADFEASKAELSILLVSNHAPAVQARRWALHANVSHHVVRRVPGRVPHAWAPFDFVGLG
jgi:hypothetical protein